MLKKCPCGITFVPRNNRQKYHSRQCCDKFKAQKYRLERKLNGLCPQCGDEMDYPVSRHKKKQTINYCSKCREKFKEYYKKNKEVKI